VWEWLQVCQSKRLGWVVGSDGRAGLQESQAEFNGCAANKDAFIKIGGGCHIAEGKVANYRWARSGWAGGNVIGDRKTVAAIET
jgi:hypothetical protein